MSHTLEQHADWRLEACETSGRIAHGDARAAIHNLVEMLAGHTDVARLEVAGSLRRRLPTVGDADLVIECTDTRAVFKAVGKHPSVARVIKQGLVLMRIELHTGLCVDLRAVTADHFGAALLHYTGSAEHNIALRRRATARGLSLSEYGVRRGDEIIAAATEADVYAALDLPFIHPRDRCKALPRTK